MSKNKKVDKKDYNMSDRHKERHINEDELDLKNERNDNKKRDEV